MQRLLVRIADRAIAAVTPRRTAAAACPDWEYVFCYCRYINQQWKSVYKRRYYIPGTCTIDHYTGCVYVFTGCAG